MLIESHLIGLAAASPLDFLFHTWSYTIRGEDIFAHETRDDAMYYFRIGLALVAAGFRRSKHARLDSGTLVRGRDQAHRASADGRRVLDVLRLSQPERSLQRLLPPARVLSLLPRVE